MNLKKYSDYIVFLRENFGNLVEYRELTGQIQPKLSKVNEDLFNEDPFIVYGASLIATAEFADLDIYH